jgi:SAM-dependent methyltransferase
MAQSYTGIDHLETMAAARNYNEFLAGEVLARAAGAKVAVDFGAGCGTYARALCERGLRVVCVEPDAKLRLALAARGLEHYENLGELPEQSVEYIFSLNVLEHIEDDQAALIEMYGRLRPGGVLYLYVPAFPVLFTSMDRKVGHFRRYRRRPLVARLQQAGFEVREARYADSLGFFVTLLYRLIGSRQGELNPAALRFYDRVLFPLSRLLDRVLGRVLGKNLSLTAIRPA